MTRSLIILAAIFCSPVLFATLMADEPLLPEAWQKNWEYPPVEMRPLQIVHGYFKDDPRYYSEQCGLGGVVCNVGPNNYLRNEAEWQRLVRFVQNAKEAGVRIWIYDEDGYPSPMAGGLVLEGHPELECLALVYDANEELPFAVRPAYEFTHASNNYCAMRRYPNLLDPAATNRFLEVTHNAYRDHLGPELLSHVEAFFTDEPSLNTVNLGLVPEHIRPNVRTADPIDPTVKPLPMVPWYEDLPEKYREKYGENLLAVRKSLFAGESEADKKTRQQFWSLVAELHAERYYGLIKTWCRKHGASFPTLEKPDASLRLASSGHTLHEEFLVSHVPLDGNKLSVLARFDVPGLDMLNSNPQCWYGNGWTAAAYPSSSALLEGKRLVMTEVCDHAQRVDEGSGPASLAMMQATAAWQATWGVTEFTLYYGIVERDGMSAEQAHSQYANFVGRLNAVLRDATPIRPIVLYYPIRDLQAEYLPMAEPIRLVDQTAKSQTISDSYRRLGCMLIESQIPFVVADDHYLAKFAAAPGSIFPKGIIIPQGVEPSNKLVATLRQMTARDTTILYDTSEKPITHADLAQELAGRYSLAKLEPFAPSVVSGTFVRDKRTIYILVNTGADEYSGKLHTKSHSEQPATENNWLVLDPETGKISREKGNALAFQLKPNQTVLFVQAEND